MAKKNIEKIPDYFGEYIGGARRDDWRSDGLSGSDLDDMNTAELRKYVNRDSVWPLPDAIKAVEAGENPFVVYWKRVVRRTTYKSPYIHTGDDLREKSLRYVEQLRGFRDLVREVKAWEDITKFYNAVDKLPLDACISSYDLRMTHYKLGQYKRACANSGFPYVKKKQRKPRKKAFIPPQLEHIEREGTDYRTGIAVTPEIWQDTFNFRGVEFGNWTSQKDRQVSMDYAFDALKDLSYSLMIEDTDITFDGRLALAFGARGRSNASAHYEPEREVINLTKMHGAGCTAHCWFHAFDDILAKHCGVSDGKLASETKYTEKLPKSYVRLIKALKHDSEGKPTDYYRGSREFGRHFAKDSFGAWDSNCEMAARAFACYVKDVLGYKSDYLIAHADVYTFEFEDQGICAIPQGEEREIFNEMFDQLFFDLKELGFFHERSEKSERPVTPGIPLVVEKTFVETKHRAVESTDSGKELLSEEVATKPQVKFYLGTDGQLRFSVAIA